MSTLNKLHLSRWNAAKALFESLKKVGSEPGNAILFYHGKIAPESIVITETEIIVVLDHCTYGWFECDVDMDAGLFTSIKEYEAGVRTVFDVVRIIPW